MRKKVLALFALICCFVMTPGVFAACNDGDGTGGDGAGDSIFNEGASLADIRVRGLFLSEAGRTFRIPQRRTDGKYPAEIPVRRAAGSISLLKSGGGCGNIN